MGPPDIGHDASHSKDDASSRLRDSSQAHQNNARPSIKSSEVPIGTQQKMSYAQALGTSAMKKKPTQSPSPAGKALTAKPQTREGSDAAAPSHGPDSSSKDVQAGIAQEGHEPAANASKDGNSLSDKPHKSTNDDIVEGSWANSPSLDEASATGCNLRKVFFTVTTEDLLLMGSHNNWQTGLKMEPVPFSICYTC